MISESTAEVNISAELADCFASSGACRAFALAPGPGPRSPYDTSVLLRGKGMLLQFKRPVTTARGYKYKLNADSPHHDQHLRLLHLERSGCAVYYGLPMFHMIPQLVSGRGSLRLMTAWFRPTQLMPEDGPVGAFEAECDTGSNVWTVRRKQVKFVEAPMSFPELAEDFARRGMRHNLEMLLNKINDVCDNGIAPEGNSYVIAANMQLKSVPPAGRKFLDGQLVLGLVPDEPEQQPQARQQTRKPQQKGQPA